MPPIRLCVVGADGRMEQIEDASDLIHLRWERRDFDMPLNIPGPFKQWLWDQL